MVSNTEFIAANRNKIIHFKPKIGSRTRGLPVGKYLIITNGLNGGYSLYNASKDVRALLFRTEFENIQDAWDFCQAIRRIYKHLLVILSDSRYSENFFQITQYTVENGEIIYEHIRSFDRLDKIRRPDLVFLLDK